MPAQHGNTETLKRMQRGYSRDVRVHRTFIHHNSIMTSHDMTFNLSVISLSTSFFLSVFPSLNHSPSHSTPLTLPLSSPFSVYPSLIFLNTPSFFVSFSLSLFLSYFLCPTLTFLYTLSLFPSFTLFLSLSHLLLHSVIPPISHSLLLSLSLTQAYDQLVRNAREIIAGDSPEGVGLGLSSDFIAGFCGETDEEHQVSKMFPSQMYLHQHALQYSTAYKYIPRPSPIVLFYRKLY